MDRKLIDGIFKTIVRINLSEAKDAIPDSLTFSRSMLLQHGIEGEILSVIINILNNSHKIFVFEIQRDSSGSKGDKIEGYVDADITTIRKLITTYGKMLVAYYEDRYHKEALPQAIIKELMANMSNMVNSEIGMIANKFIMLNEYEKLLQKQYNEYTEEWKEAKLTELFEQQVALMNQSSESETDNAENAADTENSADADVKNTDTEESVSDKEKEENRVVDTYEFKEYDHKKDSVPIEKLLSIYGISFFVRVNFRRYDFITIEKMIRSKIISRKSELRTVKKMLETVKSNIGSDKNLANHIMEINHLERVVNQYLI
jgi:hypothetical protein